MRGKQSHSEDAPMFAFRNIHWRNIGPAYNDTLINHHITGPIVPDVLARERIVGIEWREGYSAKIDALCCDSLACGAPTKDQVLTYIDYFDHP